MHTDSTITVLLAMMFIRVVSAQECSTECWSHSDCDICDQIYGGGHVCDNGFCTTQDYSNDAEGAANTIAIVGWVILALILISIAGCCYCCWKRPNTMVTNLVTPQPNTTVLSGNATTEIGDRCVQEVQKHHLAMIIEHNKLRDDLKARDEKMLKLFESHNAHTAAGHENA
jgi:hypothetical protein